MEQKIKKQAAMLGGRIGLVFLVAAGVLIFIAYFVLSQNFKNLLTEYTVDLIQSMADQGAKTVEYELQVNRQEVSKFAESFPVPEENDLFPEIEIPADVLRMVYFSGDTAIASDGRTENSRDRQDITTAYGGSAAVYGPYFNEANEYVICFSAPVIRSGEIVGVLSVEKDGYNLCEIIKEIRFVNTGESYIINAEGTDIAVSDYNHIDWVKEEYNAQRLLEGQDDPATRSVMELERKGLAGETGVGTYEWEGSLCYVAYAPISSMNWVLLAGMRQEEIDAMTHSVLYESIITGPALTIGIIVFFLLTALIIYWIVSSMKKSAEINERLNIIANYDALTGTMNRNSFHTAMDALSQERQNSLACVYVDVNGLHEINNHLGHHAGDTMLKAVAEVLSRFFAGDGVYRIGGDEFVVFCKDHDRETVSQRMELVRQDLKKRGYEISVGIDWQNREMDAQAMVNRAEEAMQLDKRRYYQEKGGERQMRELDCELEQMVLQKQDADAFLSVLAPEFNGVYFVDLGSDTIRHLYIPVYFEEMLKEAGDVFSKALTIYMQRLVAPEYRSEFEKFCDYSYVKGKLEEDVTPELVYQKVDGTRLKLRVLKFKTYTQQHRETLWIFSNTDHPQKRNDE